MYYLSGSCLFWEFATEAYDVGFGVYFEWCKKTSATNISVNVNESDNDEDVSGGKQADTKQDPTESNESNEPPTVISENESNLQVKNSNHDEVLAVLRRNSHEEVIVGSHMYPGQGVYLLKFDNSYSLLRSKTLYYRVYYTK